MDYWTEQQVYKFKILETLETLTQSAISNSMLLKKYGNNYTVYFHNLNDNKYYKATLKHKCLISNIREDI